MGSPDPRQIDGLGGAHPLTSKVAIVSRSTLPDCDIDFLFAQVGVDEAAGRHHAELRQHPRRRRAVRHRARAGRGARGPGRSVQGAHAQHRHDRRTADRDAGRQGPRMTARRASTACREPPRPSRSTFSMPRARSAARCCRPGMPSTASPASTCTLIDNGMPVIVLAAADVGRTGYEPRDVLEQGPRAEGAARGDPARRRPADGSRRRRGQGRAEDGARRAAAAGGAYLHAQLHPA